MKDRPHWRDASACLDADPELFFGLDGEPEYIRDKREAKAKAVCRGCPVSGRCLLLALGTDTPWGVFGGLGEQERADYLRSLRRTAREAAAAELEQAS